MDTAPTAAAGGGVGLQRVVVEGETVGADGGGANEGEAFRAEEDDTPEGAERTNRAALRRRVAGAAAVAETEVALASRGGRGRRRGWQGRARGRSTAARAVLG
jgi:hypothetical protein